MHKIDGSGNVAGTFVHEDPSINQPGTLVTEDWLNAVQAEIISVIEGAGAVLNKADNTQLKTAIQSMIASGATDYIARFTTTANINLNGLAVQAGGDWAAPLTAGDVVLVKDQAAPAANFLYLAAAGAWTRVPYADVDAEIKSGCLTQVREGTTLADSIWMLTTDGVITLGVTGLVFQRKGRYTCTVLRFMSNGIFVVPENITSIYITSVAGGGGGGGTGGCPTNAKNLASGGAGGGGAGQSVIKQEIAVTPGETLNITIGAGGSGGTAGGSGATSGGSGGAGGNTELKRGAASLSLVTGGLGGGGVNGPSGSVAVAAGGTGGANGGSSGQMGFYSNVANANGTLGGAGGTGGSSILGSGGRSPGWVGETNNGSPGLAATTGFGGGGSGASGAATNGSSAVAGGAGGAGTAGILIIEY